MTANEGMHNSNLAPVSCEPLQSPGARLREAREAAALSLKEVADKLHLVSAQIAALEEDRYDFFHAEIFCKGYLRSYGKLMELETAPLLNAYAELRPSPANEPYCEKICHVQTPNKGRSFQYWCIAIVVAVGALLWIMSGDGNTQPLPSLLHDDSLLAVDEHDRSSVKTLEGGGIKTATDHLPDVAEKIAQVRQMASTDAAFDVNSSRLSQPTQESFDNQISSTTADVLDFHFSADCWVKVIDRHNNVLVAGLQSAEEVLKLRGSAPFKVVLGYAPAVSLQYNGQSIKIDHNNSSNTASIVVGQS